MKHLKLFEEFNFRNLFKSKEQKGKEELYRNKDLSKFEDETSKSSIQIMIDCEHYDISQFGQKKFGVYIENDNKHYYIGDIREFTKTKGTNPYMSYLNIEKFIEKEPDGTLCHPNKDQMKIIEEELSKNYMSPNLMDDTITLREFLKNKGVLRKE
jgi:hypothetical protein